MQITYCKTILGINKHLNIKSLRPKKIREKERCDGLEAQKTFFVRLVYLKRKEKMIHGNILEPVYCIFAKNRKNL